MLLHPIVQVLVRAVEGFAPYDPSDGLRVSRMLVRRQAQRLAALTIDQTAQESPGSLSVTVLTEHRVEEVSVSVDDAVEIAPATADFDVGRIQESGCSGTAEALGTMATVTLPRYA